ncbi:MAG: CPBP family glutamic-type intramembrane protease [Acidobacteriaceae bacterium]
MSPPPETPRSAAIPFNAPSQIQKRLAAGRIPWTGPLLLVSARTVLWLTLQFLLALVLFALHRPTPLRTAGQWWIIYANLCDLCCLLGLRYFTHKEGIRLRDLIGPIRLRYGRDLFLGLGLLLFIFPFFIGGSYLAQVLLYGSTARAPINYLLQTHTLPLWATVYSLTVWWAIQSATEEMTYNGYALPRLEALTDRTWIAWLMVGFWFAAQHCVIPFVPDWRYLLFRFLAFLSGVLVTLAFYLRIRRLAPLIFAHWPMDIAAAIMTGIH